MVGTRACSVSAKVVVQKEGQKARAATVMKAHDTLMDYDILYPDGVMEKGTPAHMLRDLRVRCRLLLLLLVVVVVLVVVMMVVVVVMMCCFCCFCWC